MKSLLLISTVAMAVTGCTLFAPKHATIAANPTPTTPLVVAPVAVAPVVAAIEEVDSSLCRDINNDGVVDTISILDDGGSLFGGNYLTILNGKTKKRYSANNADFYGAVISIRNININEPSFAKVAQELLLPKETRQRLDPLGSWVVRANYNKRIYNNNVHFDMVSKPKLVWGNDKSICSEDYCVKVTASKAIEYLQHRSRHQDEEFAAAGCTVTENCNSVWMVYNGYRFNIKPLEEVYRDGKSIIYANNNCIGIERGGKFAWLFVYDNCLFGRVGGKIGLLEVKEGLMLLELQAPKLVIVDIATGKVASLKPYSKEYPYDDEGNIKQSIIEKFKLL